MTQKLCISTLLLHSMVIFSMENQLEESLNQEKHPDGCEKLHSREEHSKPKSSLRLIPEHKDKFVSFNEAQEYDLSDEFYQFCLEQHLIFNQLYSPKTLRK